MGRNAPNTLYMSYEWSAAVNQGHFDNFDWTPGGQVTFGYRFGCCCDWAIEATYWGLAESDTDGQPILNTPPAAPHGTPLTMGLVDILGTVGGSPNGTQSAADYFDNSPNQHVWRAWQVQNVEVNVDEEHLRRLLQLRVSVDFMVGFRWFRFQDGLIFGSEHPLDGTAYAGDWIYLNDHITNDLIGAQTGFDLSYRFLNCWKAFIRPEFGIFNNHTQLNYNLYAVSSTTGQQYQASSETYANPNYPVHATGNDFAFLTQVDVGLDWQTHPARFHRGRISRVRRHRHRHVGRPGAVLRQRHASHRQHPAQRQPGPQWGVCRRHDYLVARFRQAQASIQGAAGRKFGCPFHVHSRVGPPVRSRPSARLANCWRMSLSMS